MKLRRIYTFGRFRLDATVKVLLKDGEPVHAPRKAVETLLVLVENRGQVVSKEELMGRLWPDRVVNEANLAQNIAVVRRFMAAEAGAPGFIETFAGTGYRVMGPVSAADEPVEMPAAEPADAAPAAAVVAPAPVNGAVEVPAARRGFSRAWVFGLLAVVLVGIATRLLWRRPAYMADVHRVPVTRLAGKEDQPAISRDGKMVAFVWERDEPGKGGIWLQRVGDASPRRITPDDAATYSSPAWSPDGRELAYLRFDGEGGSIRISPLDGGAARVVAAVFPSRYGLSYRHLDWAPDGSRLAVDDTDSSRQSLGIFEVTIKDGKKRRLTQPEAVIVGDVDPRYSTDGKRLSFIRVFHRASQELFTMAAGGGQPVQLTSDARQISGQDWMANGRELVFASDKSGEFRLWRTGWGEARPTGIYGDFPIQLSVCRGGEALVYSVLQHDLNIWRLDLQGPPDGGDRWKRLIASSGLDASPQYSPAGNRVCFRSDRSGDEQLWVADGDGGNAVQVTQGRLRPSVGRWSPDGRSLVFNNAGTSELFIAQLDEQGTWTVRTAGLNGVHPVYSPDGKWIYAGTLTSIIRIPAQGGAATLLAPTMGISLGMSRDGRYVYFVREPSSSVLWRVDVNSRETEKVLDGLVPYCSSCWSLSEAGIYFLGQREGSGNQQALYFQDFASGRKRVVVDYPETLSPIGSGPFSLSADGRYLLCVRRDPSNSDVFRVEPFR